MIQENQVCLIFIVFKPCRKSLRLAFKRCPDPSKEIPSPCEPKCSKVELIKHRTSSGEVYSRPSTGATKSKKS